MLQTFFTTTTAPPWTWTFADIDGNVPPSFASSAFSLTFRSMSTGQKVRGGGTFTGANGTTGQVTYNLSSTDLASAFAVSALGALVGTEVFEVFAEAVISSLVYDALPVQIQIRKI